MTDLHSHLIYGIDDGARTIEESIELLKKLKETGFDKVIITPHYINSSEYSADNSIKTTKLEEIKKRLSQEKIDISIYLGNEIFINKSIDKLIKEDKIHTINNSKYLLIELPFHNKIVNVSDILYELTCKGYIPILAHPERYTYIQDNYSLIDELKEEGLLFQCNYASILGYYGKESQKLMKYMLKKGYVDYFGTDLHRLEKTYVIDNFGKIEKNIKKIIGEKNYQDIKENADKLIN